MRLPTVVAYLKHSYIFKSALKLLLAYFVYVIGTKSKIAFFLKLANIIIWDSKSKVSNIVLEVPDWTSLRILLPIQERKIQSILRPLLSVVSKSEKSLVYIDVGAHIGFHTISLCHQMRNVLCIAIEPEHLNFRFLKRNVLLNNLDNVILLPAAAYSNIGVVYLNTSLFSDLHSLTQIPEFSTKKCEAVLALPLDRVLISLGNVITVIKIDVEGAEIEVLKGASEFLQRGRYFILLELWLNNLNEFVSFLEKKRISGLRVKVLRELSSKCTTHVLLIRS